jgi:hypothetical protein
MRANMDLQPLPSTELLKTWGDITETTALLGFRPKVLEALRLVARIYCC